MLRVRRCHRGTYVKRKAQSAERFALPDGRSGERGGRVEHRFNGPRLARLASVARLATKFLLGLAVSCTLINDHPPLQDLI